MFEKYAEKSIPQRDIFIADFKKYIRTFPSSRLHLRFTKDGVMNFLMTYKLHEIPEHLYRPADFPDRIKLLQRLSDLIEGSWDIRLLKGPLEKFPLNLHLFSASNYGYIMFSRPNSELSYILLREQNILSSFYDFACSLEENDYLETKEETLRFLRTVIQENASAAAEHV